MAELKHCPFCGGEAKLVNSFNQRGNYSVVVCLLCGISGKRSYIPYLPSANQAAKDLWNRRANDGQRS